MIRKLSKHVFLSVAFLVSACSSTAQGASFEVGGTNGTTVRATVLEDFNSPWAMTFLPDGRSLVTEKGGRLWIVGTDGRKQGEVGGLPTVEARGQGGFGDIILHPDFAQNRIVYLSYVERDAQDNRLSGAAVERAVLSETASGGTLEQRQVIWRQEPKVTGNGHYGHRLAFSPDGFLFITSGERQKFTPAQDMTMNLGKMIRLTEAGQVPQDNPFAGQGNVAAQVWSLGHRNPLGMAFDASGQLWAHEMGPRGGDELNRIVRGQNYGYPEVSDGSHYSGQPIPSHSSDARFKVPAISWVPSISPAGLVIYRAGAFPGWQGQALLGGLSSAALIRVSLAGETASEQERYEWGSRVREVEQGPDGTLYVLEDGGRLLRIDPAGS